MNIDPSTTKYLIRAKISADGIVEKPDVVGAIFGQTEGLLGDELDLRDLQKSGRIGRIEVEIDSKIGKSEGEIIIPSSLDQVETSILASSLETIDRVGPCKAKINISIIEDVRLSKRNKIVERAKELLSKLLEATKTTGADLTDSVRQAVQIEEIVTYGKDKLPAGPNVADSDAIIVVEGRSDVLNLLRCGIKNAIGVEGTNIPQTIQDLARERVVTAFVDGDRGGELILRELLQVTEVDFIARAPRGQEVEELTEKQVMKCLRNKIPAEQFVEMYGFGEGIISEKEMPLKTKSRAKAIKEERVQFEKPTIQPEFERPKEEKPAIPMIYEMQKTKELEPKAVSQEVQRIEKKLSPQLLRYKKILLELTGTSKAKLLNAKDNVVKEVAVRDLAEVLKSSSDVTTVVFDGIVTQRLLDIALDIGVNTIVGTKIGNVTKQPTSINIWTKSDIE